MIPALFEGVIGRSHRFHLRETLTGPSLCGTLPDYADPDGWRPATANEHLLCGRCKAVHRARWRVGYQPGAATPDHGSAAHG